MGRKTSRYDWKRGGNDVVALDLRTSRSFYRNDTCPSSVGISRIYCGLGLHGRKWPWRSHKRRVGSVGCWKEAAELNMI